MFFLKKKVYCALFSLIFFNYSVNASLTAITADTIHGSAPTILETSISALKNNINISIKREGRVTSSESWEYDYSITPGSDDDIYLSLDTQFKNVIPSLTPTHLTESDISDLDGDYLSDTNPYIMSNFSYSWFDKNNTEIAATSTNVMGGNICTTSSSYLGPFTLKISFDVVINTKYGDPHSSAPLTIERSFNVHANDGICYVQPGVLALNTNNGWPEGNNQAPAGRNSIMRDPTHNSTVFEPHKGFKAWAATKFPTLAFEEARFQLIPKNAISNYTITIKDNPNSALISQSQFKAGQFKFGNTKPSQNDIYTFEIKPKDKTGVSYFYNFKLKSSRSWFWAGPTQKTTPINGYRYSVAVSDCGGESNMPTRLELTNSVDANTASWPSSEYGKNNGFMRDFGSLTAEWGHIYYYAPGRHSSSSGDLQDMMTTAGFSNLQKYYGYWYYYTNEVGPGGNHRTVGFIEGNVGRDTLGDSNGGIVCVN